MSAPFIEQLTRMYLEYVSNEERPKAIEPVAETKSLTQGVDNIAEIDDANEMAEKLDKQVTAGNFATIVISGVQGSGKSVIARTLAHNFHARGFSIAYSSGFDIFDAPEKLVKIASENRNVFVVIDDVSYTFGAVSGRASSRLKNFIATIRHSLGGARVVLCIVTHTTGGIPPILRNSQLWLFSAPNLSEYDSISRLTGRSKLARERLERTFGHVTALQAKAIDNGTVTFNYAGHAYQFQWGTGDNPGHGRLMLAIINGKPLVYNSKNEYCDLCQHVAFTPKIDNRNYQNLNPSPEQVKASKEVGTQR